MVQGKSFIDRLLLAAVAGIVPLTGHAQPLSAGIFEDRRLPLAELASEDPLALVGQSVVLVRTAFPVAAASDVLDTSETGTGFLVAPCIVMTARHVLGRPPVTSTVTRSIQVTFFRRDGGGQIVPVSRTATVRAMGGGSGRWSNQSVNDDWALLELAGVAMDVLPVGPAPDDCCAPRQGRRFALAGFPADHFDPVTPTPWVDPDCRVTERLANRMLATNCVATSGNSGGPLLVLSDQGWRVAGILTRAAPPDALGRARRADNFVLPLNEFLRRQVDRAWRSSACAPAPAPVFIPPPLPQRRPTPVRQPVEGELPPVRLTLPPVAARNQRP